MGRLVGGGVRSGLVGRVAVGVWLGEALRAQQLDVCLVQEGQG